MIFGFEKFRPYLIGVSCDVYTDQSDVNHLLSKKVTKSRLVR